MESASNHISESLSLLKEQEEKYQSFMDTASLKDHFWFLKHGLPLLRILLSIFEPEGLDSYIEDFEPEGLDSYIEDELCDVRVKLNSLSNRPIEGSLISELGNAYSDLREKIKNLLIKNYEMLPKEINLESISRYLLSFNADLNTPQTKEIDDIKGKLTFLQPLFTYLVNNMTYLEDEDEEILKPLYFLIYRVTCLVYFCLVDKMDEEVTLKMMQELSDLVEMDNIKKIYMELLIATSNQDSLLDNLVMLLEWDAKSVIYQNDMSKNLLEKLKFLQNFIGNLPRQLRYERANFHFVVVEAIAWKLVPILFPCYDRHIEEDMAGEVNIALSEVLDKIKQIEEDSKEVKLYKYPKVDGEGFLDLFIGHLEELLKLQPSSIKILKNQIQTLHAEFNFLRSRMIQIKEQNNKHKELGDLWTHFIGLAYRAEYVIDFYLVKKSLDSRIIRSFSKIIEETELIKTEVITICTQKRDHTHAHDVAETSIHVSLNASNIAIDEIVGFEDDAKKIKEYLFEDQEKLDIISIVGMPGLGKTTLAKKVYEDPLIRDSFHVRAWCVVSQTYQKRALLLTILGDVFGKNEDLNRLNDEELVKKLSLCKGPERVDDEELARKLYQSLKGRRYLIVIDDLWNIEDWDDFKRSFPDDRLRSRIIITTRVQKLGSLIKDNSKVHTLREFSRVESWELFAKKLFQKGSFSSEFLVIGQQIVESCKGLPLTIVVMAGILAKVERSTHKWKLIAGELSSYVFSDSESHCKAMLELSYCHLPDHLQSCFLYFAIFPEDEEIPLQKLKLLWIAEGIVRHIKGRKLEDVAEEYFVDLINRSIVIPTKRSSCGRVKACRVHDLLHDFCLQKAKEESFLQVINGSHWSEFARVHEVRRLSIKRTTTTIKEALYNVRSLKYTGSESPRDLVYFLFKNFRLLRVLDLTNGYHVTIGYAIELLIHLRYLAMKCCGFQKSIAKLWYLQSLILQIAPQSLIDYTFMGISLCNMVNLRHIRINHYFRFEASMLKNSSLLDNVQTLSTPLFQSKKEADNILRKLPNLRKLRCQIGSYLKSAGHEDFPDLRYHRELVSLSLCIKRTRPWKKKCEFYFPPSLEKLSLLEFLPNWENFVEFGKNLKVLKLSGKCYNAQWIVKVDFPDLKYLKLSGLSICKWIASEDSFPKLEQLVIESCSDLDEIPPCFGVSCTLRVITVRNCRRSVYESARKIEKTQKEELCNEEFKVYVM